MNRFTLGRALLPPRILAVLIAFSGAAHATPEDIISQWAFNETEHRAAAVKGPSLCEGMDGTGFAFDGLDDFVALGTFAPQRRMTLAFWMRPDDLWNGQPLQGLVSSDAWGEGMFHVALRDGMVQVTLHRRGEQRSTLSSDRLNNGSWYHVALTADRPESTVRLYINGHEQESSYIGNLGTDFVLDQLTAGRESGERYFRGILDDVRLYSRVLAPAEVRVLCPDAPALDRDWRNIRTGHEIPSEGYCDQPYVVLTQEGHWLCTMTTGPGEEGAGGQHVVSTLSTDQGRTWTPLVPIEPGTGPEASWAMPLVTDFGRVYAFYSYNGDQVRTLGDQENIRADMLGWYCYRYSDDSGSTWSSDRYRLPMRVTNADRSNDWTGEEQIFWGIGKPIRLGGSAMLAFTKIGRYMLDDSEGWFFRSPNILTERDVTKLEWEMLPDGDAGLRSPDLGSIQSEQNIVPLNDGGLYCMYRTITGHPAHAYSRDGGRTWSTPEPATYTPGGRPFKHPRACPRIWKTANGNYLFWFHNHGGTDFNGRNPAWICGGMEKDGHLHWSEPEILLYDPDMGPIEEQGIKGVRISYPDLIEQDGRYWVTETQKSIARVHEVDPALFEALWTQGSVREVVRDGLALEIGPDRAEPVLEMPALPDLRQLGGFSIDLWIDFDALAPDTVLVDTHTTDGKGLALVAGEDRIVRLEMSDGVQNASWESDPVHREGKGAHHVVATVDGGPGIITFVVDGQLCDGGSRRQFGWGRFAPNLGDVNGGGLRVAGAVRRLRVYARPLRTSEAVANCLAGLW